MATTETVKVLGQVSGSGAIGTYGVVYACPTSTTTVTSTIAVCNTASTAATYRVAITTASAAPTLAEFVVYGATVAANDTVFLTNGLTLTSTQKWLVASSSASTVSFSAYGIETTTS